MAKTQESSTFSDEGTELVVEDITVHLGAAGLTAGEPVGLAVGEADGGDVVPRTVGEAVGEFVGAPVGDLVGLVVAGIEAVSQMKLPKSSTTQV